VRIAIGQLWQETNTFNPQVTTRDDFEKFGICRGDELVRQMADVNELGGFIQSLRKWPARPEIVGLVRLPAWPSGRATTDTFAWLQQEFLSELERALPVDALLLALHGAMVAEEHPDVEGPLLAQLRERIGARVPIVATLDLHANVTLEMVRAADVLVTYHSMPHVDIFETGQRAAEVLRRILLDGARPVTAFAKIPAVVPPENSSTEAASGVAVDLKRDLVAWERQPRVLAAGLTPVQPWLDIPQLGTAALVTTDDDPGLARQACAAIANEFWARRREYLPELLSVEEAVAKARQAQGLVVLSDAADATTSGAPGDSVWILQELLKHRWPRAALVTVVAPAAVARCEQAGVGAPIQLELGGLRDNRCGTRLVLEATVERCFDGRFSMTGHIGRNMPIDMGRCCVVRHAQNVCVVLTSRSGPHFAPELFRTAGCDPFAASLVVAKSPCGFRAVYESRAESIYCVRAPGCAPSDFWNYSFSNIPRPLWPWDNLDAWTADPHLYPENGVSVRAGDRRSDPAL